MGSQEGVRGHMGVKGHVGSYERRAEVTWEVRGHVGRGELGVHGGVKGHM